VYRNGDGWWQLGLYSAKDLNYSSNLGTTLEQENQAIRENPLSNDMFLELIRKIEGGDASALITLYDKTSRRGFA
jgi:hypothetical protein